MGAGCHASACHRSRTQRGLGMFVAATCLGGLFAHLGASAGAQELEIQPPANALVQLPAMNAAQRDMAGSIDRVCPTLIVNEDQLNPQQLDLRDVCRRMVHTARDALDLPEGARDQTYGLGVAETRNVLQRINGEELQTPQAQIEEIGGVQVGNITARLDALRAGLAGPGLSVAGLSLSAGDRQFALGDPNQYLIVPAQWQEDGFLSRLGLFATGAAKFGDKDPTGAADGFDFDTLGVTVGADYRLTDQFVMGLAFGYSKFDADFDTTARSAAGQQLESDTFTASLFGSYQFTEGPFVDAIATVGWSDYDSRRRIVIISETGQPSENRTATGSFDAVHYGVATNVGYDVALGAFTVTPLARLEFLRADIDGFTEQGANGLNLQFGDHTAESLTVNVGVEARYALSTAFAVIIPSVRAEYVHDFLGDSDGPRVAYAADPTPLSAFQLTTETTDRNYGIVGAGVAATLPAGWAAFVDWHTLVGLSNFDVHAVNLGLRKEF